jgi:hypothetical protein
LRKWSKVALKLLWGGYLALTSLYCLLAFLPYTYYALIKAPAYPWVPVFVGHHALLFWMACLGAAFAFWPPRLRPLYLTAFGIAACVGTFLAGEPFLADLQSDRKAYWGSIAALWLLILIVALCGLDRPERKRNQEAASATKNTQHLSLHFPYGTAVWLAMGIAIVTTAATHLKTIADARAWQWHAADFYVALWSVVTHVIVAILLVSVANLVRSAASRTSQPEKVKWILFNGLIFGGFWVLFLRFLENALSFEGWLAQLYAASLAAALTLLGFSVARPFLAPGESTTALSPTKKIIFGAICVAFVLTALAMPTLLGGGDWNGFYEGAFTLLFWIGLSVAVFRLWPRRDSYQLRSIFAVLVLSVVAYKALGTTQMVWAKPLGTTEDEIQRKIENYAVQDVSFNLTNRLLGNGHSDPCGDLCRILREYTEIRGAKATRDVRLVDPLKATSGERPNIFIFVIDSVRPDYLGAYNAKATFTPNLDTFARESVVVHNAFTTYAGTSLSEPAIWAGALLLHAHFQQPFERVNSLEKLARTDGYKMFVSHDEVLSQILSPADNAVQLDTEKKLWNQLEVCSTVHEAEAAFEQREDKTQPIFFYTQPKNVHQFARNDLPTAKSANWPAQPGFNYRISFELHQVDECLGGFFGWLKEKEMYDNSIIVVTSDHGDATGEFGRSSHSVIIYPEVMRVPLLIHLPKSMQGKLIHYDRQVSALIDIAPTLYYLLGHRPIVANPLFGRPLFAETDEELQSYPREDLFLASDVRAAYGILSENGRYLYATYDSPAHSYLYDLADDPNGEHDILTGELKKEYDGRVIEYLQQIGDFYGYKPGIGSLLGAQRKCATCPVSSPQ